MTQTRRLSKRVGAESFWKSRFGFNFSGVDAELPATIERTFLEDASCDNDQPIE